MAARHTSQTRSLEASPIDGTNVARRRSPSDRTRRSPSRPTAPYAVVETEPDRRRACRPDRHRNPDDRAAIAAEHRPIGIYRSNGKTAYVANSADQSGESHRPDEAESRDADHDQGRARFHHDHARRCNRLVSPTTVDVHRDHAHRSRNEDSRHHHQGRERRLGNRTGAGRSPAQPRLLRRGIGRWRLHLRQGRRIYRRLR